MNIEEIRINHPACDWITLTTWHYKSWYDLVHSFSQTIEHNEPKKAQKLQYDGYRWLTNSGSFFYAIGQQMGKTHCIIEVSGALAHGLLEYMQKTGSDYDIWTCTRIDLQVTRILPEWNPRAYLQAAEDRGQTVGFCTSKDSRHGRLSTVYVGSQRSGRFARIYEKIVADTKHVRAEIVFRRAGGSDVLFHRVVGIEPNYHIANAFSGSIHALKSPELSPFEVDAVPELPRVSRQESRTIKWLRETVLPVFKRVVSQHDGQSSEVAHLFLECIRHCNLPDDWPGDL